MPFQLVPPKNVDAHGMAYRSGATPVFGPYSWTGTSIAHLFSKYRRPIRCGTSDWTHLRLVFAVHSAGLARGHGFISSMFDVSRSSVEAVAGVKSYSCTKAPKGARAKITVHSWTPIHPVWLRCSSVIYLDIIHFSRLAIRAPRRPRMGIYSCPDPKKQELQTGC